MGLDALGDGRCGSGGLGRDNGGDSGGDIVRGDSSSSSSSIWLLVCAWVIRCVLRLLPAAAERQGSWDGGLRGGRRRRCALVGGVEVLLGVHRCRVRLCGAAARLRGSDRRIVGGGSELLRVAVRALGPQVDVERGGLGVSGIGPWRWGGCLEGCRLVSRHG